MPQGEVNVTSNRVLVALGSNAMSYAGGARASVLAALSALRNSFVDISISGLYQTPAFPAGSGPDFVNAACAFQSTMPAGDILAHLHKIEATFGRERNIRWGPRTLDLDLIGCGDSIQPDRTTFDAWRKLPLSAQTTDTPGELILPHPRLQDRPFVLVPLADVAPDWTHPVLGQTVAQMLAAHSSDACADITLIS